MYKRLYNKYVIGCARFLKEHKFLSGRTIPSGWLISMVPFITYIQLQRKMFSQPVVELCGYIPVVELENSALWLTLSLYRSLNIYAIPMS